MPEGRMRALFTAMSGVETMKKNILLVACLLGAVSAFQCSSGDEDPGTPLATGGGNGLTGGSNLIGNGSGGSRATGGGTSTTVGSGGSSTLGRGGANPGARG